MSGNFSFWVQSQGVIGIISKTPGVRDLMLRNPIALTVTFSFASFGKDPPGHLGSQQLLFVRLLGLAATGERQVPGFVMFCLLHLDPLDI